MAILIDGCSRILVQGITGTVGRRFAERMVTDKSPLVAGVVPGRGGSSLDGIPIFGSVLDAREATGASFALVCTPVASTPDAVSESLCAGIETVVVYTEGVPTPEALTLSAQARATRAVLLGPSSAGVVSPGRANASDLEGRWLRGGPVGIVSRSGTLVYEVTKPLHESGIGLSTVCCLGGDTVVGTRYYDVLERFAADPETEVVVLLGEIGGSAEVEAADVVASMGKPVIAYIAGRHAPIGRSLGHAGALVSSASDRADVKAHALLAAGARIVHNILDVIPATIDALNGER